MGDSVNNIVMEKLIEYIYTGEVHVNVIEKQKFIQLCAQLKLNISLKSDSAPDKEFDTSLLEICNQMSCSHKTQTDRELAYQQKGVQSELDYASNNELQRIRSTRRNSPDVTFDETAITLDETERRCQIFKKFPIN